jgi:hypothetical protein
MKTLFLNGSIEEAGDNDFFGLGEHPSTEPEMKVSVECFPAIFDCGL